MSEIKKKVTDIINSTLDTAEAKVSGLEGTAIETT